MSIILSIFVLRFSLIYLYFSFSSLGLYDRHIGQITFCFEDLKMCPWFSLGFSPDNGQENEIKPIQNCLQNNVMNCGNNCIRN